MIRTPDQEAAILSDMVLRAIVAIEAAEPRVLSMLISDLTEAAKECGWEKKYLDEAFVKAVGAIVDYAMCISSEASISAWPNKLARPAKGSD